MLAAGSPATTFCVGADELEDDRESVAQRDGRGPPGRCVPARGRRRVARGHLGRGGRGGRRAGERPARPRRAEGRLVRAPGPHLARMGALRLRPRPGRSGRGADLRQQLRARHAVRARALGRRRRARRGRRSAGEGRRAAARERDLVLGARRAARPRTRLRGGAADRARRARRLDRRGRPVHLHLYVGNDRPAEGVHDPPPQLLRDGAERRRDGRPPDGARRRDAPHLRLAKNYGRLLHFSAAYIGFTIAFLPDPLRAATELCVCSRRCSRACRASTRRSTRRL